MTRANLMIIVVLIVALVGMFFWTLTLHNRQTDMAGIGGGAAEGRGGDSALAGRLEDLEMEFDGLDELVRSQIADLGSLSRKVVALEATAGEQGARIAALGGGEVELAAVASGAGEPELQAAIETVLEQRAVRERKERTKRMAEQFSRWLLSDIEATDPEKSQFVSILTEYMSARDGIRQRFSGDNSDDQARDAEMAILDQGRNDQVISLFGAANFQKIEERLNRSRRGMDGRGRGNRGGGGR